VLQALHLDFVIAAANIHAFNYGLKPSTDIAHIKAVASAVQPPKFQPKSGVKVQTNENEAAPGPERERASIVDVFCRLTQPCLQPTTNRISRH